MIVKVKDVLGSEQKVSKANKPYTVTTFLGDDGEVYKNIFGKFEVGQEVSGEWVDDPTYGRQFKVSQAPKSGGFTKKDDPTTQKQIIRQNSLTNAVNYVLGKAQFMSKEEALKFISGKEVIQVATYFAKYSEGEVTVVTEKEEPKEAPKQAVDWEARVAEATSNRDEVEEIDLSDVPF